ncbi:MAG: sulfatase-like hydrolase/transferase, partial [Ruminococcus sp.]|nr:sulfatase-like hydrolase/transferase [Ruminococcus sp.]
MKSILIKFKNGLHTYAKENMIVLAFVICSVINAFMLRAFTVKFNYNQIKPLLADIGTCMIFGALSVLFKKRKRQFIFLLVLTIIFSIISAGNSIYYTNFRSFMSISMISTASQLGGVMDAVTKNIMEWKDLLFLWSIPAFIVVYIMIKRRNKEYPKQLQEKKLRRRIGWGTFGIGAVFLGICSLMLTGTDYSRLQKQWNREYVLATFGMYTYHISDAVSCANAQLNMMFGYDESEDLFNKFYDNESVEDVTAQVKKNKYSNMFAGKNLLFIHAESIQGFTLDTYINGEELTPTINKLAREGIYFTNFYAQESVGTTSDTEFTLCTSLMPASSGTVAINYWDRDYTTTQKLLKNMGYYAFSMHGNNGSYWNRLNVHKSYGYDKFYNSSTDFNVDETIGLGLSDKSMFKQAIPKIKEIDEKYSKWMGEMLMLTNHTPFTDIERVSDYKVDFKYKKYNEQTGLYDEVSAPFLEGRKLGSYFKSVHYADEAIAQFLDDMDKEG